MIKDQPVITKCVSACYGVIYVMYQNATSLINCRSRNRKLSGQRTRVVKKAKGALVKAKKVEADRAGLSAEKASRHLREASNDEEGVTWRGGIYSRWIEDRDVGSTSMKLKQQGSGGKRIWRTLESCCGCCARERVGFNEVIKALESIQSDRDHVPGIVRNHFVRSSHGKMFHCGNEKLRRTSTPWD